jgi:serine protease AprX
MIRYISTLFAVACMVLTMHGFAAKPTNPQQYDYTITLGEQSFDPLEHMAPMPLEWGHVAQEGNDLRLIQFDGPIQESWVESMQNAGLKPVQYIHPFTYITWAAPESMNDVSHIPHLRWSGDFVNGYRVLPKWRGLNVTPICARVMAYKGADIAEVIEQLQIAGATRIDQRSLDLRFEIISFITPGNSLNEISKIRGVFTVQPTPTDGGLRSEMSNQINAGNFDAGNNAFPGYRDWIQDVGVDGDGVTIAIVDGGSDQSHSDLSGQFVSCDGQSCGGNASSSHGTHTAGIVGATGASETTDSYGFLRGQGVAPGVSLVEQVYSPTYQQSGGMTLLMTESYRNGASASSNSWGPSGSPQGYDVDTLEVDIAVRDAEPNEEGNQQFTYVLAIMNGNGGTSSQGSPDEAKNIITVGSTKMRTSGGSQYTEINDISSNSAHGPCLDGRTIPHIVAPGCSVDSTTPGSYGLMCGTSMACPQVAGGVALFVNQYRDAYDEDPSPALIKAAITAVATDLAGNDDADGGTLGHPFDSKQGWGRMDLSAMLINNEGSVRYYDAPVVLEQTGDQWTATVSPVDPSKPMRIMLAWTDALGHGLGGSTPAWNNDLDLTVSTGLSSYKGNNIGSQGWSTTGGNADGKNNTEGVFLGPAAPTQATITVTAANLTSDGIPGEGDGIDQDFSVVCYNCAAEPGFSISVNPSTQSVCAPESVEYTIYVGQLMGYDFPITLSAEAASGITATFSQNPVIPPATVTMSVSVNGIVGDGTHTIGIVGTSSDGTAHDASAAVDVSSGLPGVASLLQPTNGATGEAVSPTFFWQEEVGVNTWRFQLSTSASQGGIIHDASNIDISSYHVPFILESNTSYYWRVNGSNNCGDGGWASWWSFTTTDAMTVLLVDDDDNSPDVRSDYIDMITAAGLLYEVYDTQNSNNEPNAATLQGYPLVIWFTGDEWGGFAGPGSSGEVALASYIDAGGHLVLSSQDYLYDNGLTGFGSSHLGIESFESDENQTTVTGSGDLFSELGSVSLNYPFTNYSDVVSPSSTGELAFSGNEGDAGVHKEGDLGGAVFLGFPIETMGPTNQQNLMVALLSWIGDTGSNCPADCNGDGIVNVVDILSIIDAWESDTGCDTNGDGVTNVTDLLDVVGSWGVCP